MLKKRLEWKITLPASHHPVLSFARTLPKDQKIVSGGRVKLIHLKARFHQDDFSANLLYVVSSAQPLGLDFWLKICQEQGWRIIWNQNGVAYPGWAGENFEKINEPMKKALIRADFVVYQSEFCKKSADQFLGEAKGAFAVIHNCVDTSLFRPLKNKAKVSSPIRVLVAGSHHQSERVLLPLQVVKILVNHGEDVVLRIAGRLVWPDGQQETKKAIKKLGLESKVEIVGEYRQVQAPKLYASADVLLHIQYNDACPTVPMEAMACGVPVIGSNSGGMPEIVQEGAGILIDVPASYEQLYYPHIEHIVNAVQQVMKDWKTYSNNARQVAMRDFDKEQWLKKHEKIFQKVITGQFAKPVKLSNRVD